jgi:hypothetical protein
MTLEDIRVLTYERLRNMAILVNAAAFFVLGTRIKLDILATHLPKAAKHIFGVPRFQSLRPGRRHPRDLRQNPQALTTRRVPSQPPTLVDIVRSGGSANPAQVESRRG